VQDEDMTTQEGAHESLRTLETWTYGRVKREFTEDHANVWDVVRRCYAAEDSAPPMIDVHRLAVKFGSKWLIALGFAVADEGWLKFDERRASRLKDELANPPSHIAKAANRYITLESASVETREHVRPSPADVVRMMRDGRIGRPSTYWRHIRNLEGMTGIGYVARGSDGRYELTQLGRRALELLRTSAFESVGIVECQELELDLDRIESGEATPLEIAVKHVSLVKNLRQFAFEKRDDLSILRTETSSVGSSLPPALDPEKSLPQDHRLRRIKSRIAIIVKEHASRSSNEARSSIRAATAFALADVWKLSSEAAILDELRFNLAYRWLCGLGPDDLVWSEPVFHQLLISEVQLVSELKSGVVGEMNRSSEQWQATSTIY
jgi:hypothetical protein